MQKVKLLLFALLTVFFIGPPQAKADTYTYGWDSSAWWSKPSYFNSGWLANEVRNLFSRSTDETLKNDWRFKAMFTNSGGFFGLGVQPVTINGVKEYCVQTDFDAKGTLWVYVEAPNSELKIRGYYHPWAGEYGNTDKSINFSICEAIYNESTNTFSQRDEIAIFVEEGKVLATGEQAKEDEPFEVTIPIEQAGWVEIVSTDMSFAEFKVTCPLIVNYNINVNVNDVQGNPLKNAKVILSHEDSSVEATNNGDGTFSATMDGTEVKDQIWSITATCPYFNDKSVDVVFDGDKDITLALDDQMYNAAVTVKGANDKLIEEATVTLYKGTTSVIAESTGAGVYKASLKAAVVDGKEWTVSAKAKYYIDGSTKFTFDGDKDLTVVLDDQMYNATVTVKGTSDEPIENATVTLYKGTNSVVAESAGTGVYKAALKAADVDGKEWTVSAKAKYYIDGYDKFTFDGDKELTLVLKDQIFTVTANVTDENNQPVSNAEVTLNSGFFPLPMTNNNDGSYSMDLLAANFDGKSVVIEASAPYYNPVSRTITIDGNNVVDFTLGKQTFTLVATVKNNDGEAISNADVTLKVAGTDYTLTAADGKYSATIDAADIDGKEAVFSASAKYYVDGSETFTISGDKEVVITLTDVIYNFSARVNDAQGVAVKGAKVEIAGVDVTENDGVFSFAAKAIDADGVTYNATASAHGYLDADYSFSLTADTDYTFVLEAVMRTYSATVTDRDGNHIEGAVVTVTDKEGNSVAVTRNEDGTHSFTLSQLEAEGNEYTVSVTAEGYDDPETKTFTLDEDDVEHAFVLDETVGVAGIAADAAAVRNIDGHLYVSGNAVICDFAGRVVRVIRNANGEEVTGLAPGFYIVANKKVIVK